MPRCEAPAGFDRMNPSHAKSEEVNAKKRATQNTDLGETWLRSRVGGFWCDSEEHPVQVAAALRDPVDLRDLIKQRLICVYAHWPQKNAVWKNLLI